MRSPYPVQEPIQEAVIEEALSAELQKHKGRWVAIFQNEVVAVGDTALEVKEDALSVSVTDPLIFRVPQNPNRIAFF